MSNPFLTGKDTHEEIDTAIIYERALILDIGNAVAYTDGKRIFINTDENLEKILPHYNRDFLKWILWHEKFHMELRHHDRFFKYLSELTDREARAEFNLSKDEINIIMDILVHDSLCKMFPELVDNALKNLAQMRNRNSLKYTFKTFNLEDMLDEYSKYKKEHEEKDTEDPTDTTEGEPTDEEDKTDTEPKSPTKTSSKKSHKEDDKSTPPSKGKDKPEEDEEIEDTSEPKEEHDKTDWSKLEDIDSKEFITEDEGDGYEKEINELRRKKLKLGRLTKTLNGLATTKRDRTYRLPSLLQTGDGCIFKGKTPGRVELYLIFDASGSMSYEMNIFKDIISKSIPQALACPCEWFSGYEPDDPKIEEYRRDYFKATFKEFLRVHAGGGYNDDGDRTIELCYLAEQKGYTPIGVTDGGGTLSWSKDKLKALKRTILVGDCESWLNECKKVNPSIQTLSVKL